MSLKPSAEIAGKKCPCCDKTFPATQEGDSCPHDGTLLALVFDDPFVGTVLSERYEILEKIGSGGWSTVYKATQKNLNRLAAIKILQSHLISDNSKILRFQREAEAASSLVHPAIASVFDYGMTPSGEPFIAMEFIEGTTLLELMLGDRLLEYRRAARIFAQICDGLEAAHTAGIVHRDIKPANIAVITTASGEQAKILDFGLAKLVQTEAAREVTKTGETVGTPNFMSPEQCMGHALDGRTDIYALGCLMYEALTGRAAMTGASAFDVMQKHLHEMPPTFAQVVAPPEIPKALETVVFKAMAKNPEDRFATAAELKQALLQSIGDTKKSLAVTPVPRTQTYGRSTKKIRILVTVTALTTIIALWFHYSMPFRKVAPPETPVEVKRPSLETWQEHLNRAEEQFQSGDYGGSVKEFEIALQHAQSLGQLHPHYLETLIKLKEANQQSGQVAVARDLAAQIEELETVVSRHGVGTFEQNTEKIFRLNKELKEKPHDKKVVSDLCQVLNNQAKLLTRATKYDIARQYIDDALKIQENPESLSQLALIYSKENKPDLAQTTYKRAYELVRFSKDETEVARAEHELGEFYREHGMLAKAKPLAKHALGLLKNDKNSAEYARCANNLALIYLQENQVEKAEKLLEEALYIRQNLYGNESIDVAKTKANLGSIAMQQRNYQQAQLRFEEALDRFDKRLGSDSLDSGMCANNLAFAYLADGQYGPAEPLFRRAAFICRKHANAREQVVRALEQLSLLYGKENRTKEKAQIDKQLQQLSDQ